MQFGKIYKHFVVVCLATPSSLMELGTQKLSAVIYAHYRMQSCEIETPSNKSLSWIEERL